MKKVYDIFLEHLPSIDLHGYDRDSARIATNDFILENVTLKNEKIVIIHGIGEGIVRKIVHQTLAKNKYVHTYKQDNFNPGITIIHLNVDKR